MSGRFSPTEAAYLRNIHRLDQLEAALASAKRSKLKNEIELGLTLDVLRRKSNPEYLASLQEASISLDEARDLRLLYRAFKWRLRRMTPKGSPA